MSEWVVKKIDDISTVIAGGTPSTAVPDYWDGDISWITPNDLSNYNQRYIHHGARNITELGLKNSSAKLLPRNTLLLTTRAPIGYLAIANGNVSTNQGFKNLICDEKHVNYMYLFYYIKLNVEFFKAFATGATFPELSGRTLKNIKINLLPLPTQTRIAEILSAYDDAIENNNRRIALLEKAARELYREWFVRMRFPGYEGIKFVNGVPEGWAVMQLGEVLSVGRGSSPRPITDEKYFRDGDIPWIKIADATKSTKFIFETKEVVNEYGASFSRKLPAGSMIIAASGTLGFPMFLGIEGCIHDGWMYFNDFSGITKEYLYFVLLEMGQYFNSISYGAAIQNINTEIIRKSKVLLPTADILNRFTSSMMDMDSELKNLIMQSQNLARQRDLLLPRLMSGQLEV